MPVMVAQGDVRVDLSRVNWLRAIEEFRSLKKLISITETSFFIYIVYFNLKILDSLL